MPQQTTLKNVTRYLMLRALADDPRTPAPERRIASGQVIDMEGEYQRIRDVSARVLAAFDGAPSSGRSPLDGPLVAGLDQLLAGISDNSRPWYLRVADALNGGIKLGPEMGRAFKDSMVALDVTPPPLGRGQVQVLLSTNGNGELEVKLRCAPRFANHAEGRRRIAGVITKRLRAWSRG